tara:strand:+ start:360 stop:1784 length:1425 start_codon:yes stop_codon:yes gene_type:complete
MKNFIIFPFLLAFLPSWQLILKNYDELILQDILISLAIIAISIAIWIVITKIIKNRNKAALITGVAIGFFFYFGYIQDALDGLIIFNIPMDKTSVLGIISIIIFIASTIYFLKSRKSFELSIKIANVFTITLILFTFVQFVTPGALAEQPNVYHIILDEYTDNEILMKKFDYNNEEFLKFLDKNGFYMPNKSFSTWESTPVELLTILNMDYPEVKRGWVSDSYESLKNNKVMSIFSNQNYSVIETNSMLRWKDFSDVDTKLCYGGAIYSDFLDQVLRKSIIKYFLEHHHNDTRRDTIRCTFNELNELASQNDVPKYVFSHILIPHPPFLFGPNGEEITPDHGEISGLQSWENSQGYINQLIYATDQVSVVIKNIIKNDPNAIIILQGDTGTFTDIDDVEQRKMKDIYQAHSILYAVRIPDVNNLESVSPVNTYRIIFNNYFNMNYEYLEQHNYTFYEDDVWVEVTEELHKYRFG